MYIILDPVLNSETSFIVRLSQKASYIVVLLLGKSRYIATPKVNFGLYNRNPELQLLYRYSNKLWGYKINGNWTSYSTIYF